MSGSFPKTNKDDWNRIASLELDGSEPINHLQWKDSDNLSYLPLYDKSDAEAFSMLRNYDLPASKDGIYGSKKWLNQPPLATVDVKNSNSTALSLLEGGADGIFFHINNEIDFNSLLQGIHPQYCELSFTGDVGRVHLDSLAKYCNDEKILSGCIFSEKQLSLTDIPDNLCAEGKFHPLGILLKQDSSANEITAALMRGVLLFDQAQDIEIGRSLVNKIAFSFPAEISFFSNIAKLKSFRILWSRVLAAYSLSSEDTYIHSRCLSYNDPQLDPHVNMLNNTNTAMSSILGGCTALSVYPADLNNITAQRISKNVSNILREESHFNKVADPIAGSYIIDTMVLQLCDKAWSNFLSQIGQ